MQHYLSPDELYGDSDWLWWSQQLTEKSEKHVTVETPLINSMSYILYNKKVTELCHIGFHEHLNVTEKSQHTFTLWLLVLAINTNS